MCMFQLPRTSSGTCAVRGTTGAVPGTTGAVYGSNAVAFPVPQYNSSNIVSEFEAVSEGKQRERRSPRRLWGVRQ